MLIRRKYSSMTAWKLKFRTKINQQPIYEEEKKQQNDQWQTQKKKY